MSETIQERFYHLLPTVYRARDLAEGQPLRALMAVLEGEYQALEEDLQAAYDNWFIDTCDLWVVPYLADLLGIRDLAHDQRLLASQRRRVANTLAYRRRKGTAAALEQVVRDVTGWEVRVVEFFRQVATTQHLASLRPRAGRTFDLHQGCPAPQVGGPFDEAARTLDVHRNDPAQAGVWPDQARRQARYNLDTLGLFFWRLGAYPLDRGYARRLEREQAGCFTFDVTGRDLPLFNRPQAAAGVSHRAQAPNLPLPLTRALLAADLGACAARYGHRPAGTGELPGQTTYYGPERSLCIWQKGELGPIAPQHIVSADLSGWQAPAPVDPGNGPGPLVAVDVELGRLMFLGDEPPVRTGDVIVSYTYGLSGDIGGGAYSRQYSLAPLDDLPDHALQISVAEGGTDSAIAQAWRISAAKGKANGDDMPCAELVQATGQTGSGPLRPVRTLEEALALWQAYCQCCTAEGAQDKRPVGVIKILDNGLYGGGEAAPDGGDLVIPLPRGAHLSIVAADGVWPTLHPRRLVIKLETEPVRMFAAELPPRQEKEPVPDRRLELNGLRIDGSPVEVQVDGGADKVEAGGGRLEGSVDLVIRHCTVMPKGFTVMPNGFTVTPKGLNVDLSPEQAQALRVQVQDSILGPMRLPKETYTLEIADSIVDHAGQGLALDGPRTTLERVTVLGETHLSQLELASDTILSGTLVTHQTEPGLLRRSFVPNALPATIRREHDPHDLALAARAAELGLEVDEMGAGEIAALQKAIRPRFTSTTYGQPAYAQLDPLCPREIRSGGDGGAEMGVFHSLNNPHREENLRRILEEYLPLGQEVSIFYLT